MPHYIRLCALFSLNTWDITVCICLSGKAATLESGFPRHQPTTKIAGDDREAAGQRRCYKKLLAGKWLNTASFLSSQMPHNYVLFFLIEISSGVLCYVFVKFVAIPWDSFLKGSTHAYPSTRLQQERWRIKTWGILWPRFLSFSPIGFHGIFCGVNPW